MIYSGFTFYSDKKLILIIFSILLFALPLTAEMTLSVTEWNMGEIPADQLFSNILEIENNSPDPVKLSLMSTCGCLSVTPSETILQPGDSVHAELIFDSSDDEGKFEKIVIIRSTHPELSKAFFIVRGIVKTGEDSGESEISAEVDESSSTEVEPAEIMDGNFVIFDYFYSPSCRECRIFLSETVPALSEKLKLRILVNGRDIQEPENYEEMISKLAEIGVEPEAFPIIIRGEAVLQGEKEIQHNIEDLLIGKQVGAAEQEDITSGTNGAKSPSAAGKGIRFLPVLAAGFLDGVNPCAFTTLIFLLTALAVAGKSRREILIIGIFFTTSVYLTYYLVGLGFFRVLRMADSFSVISGIIRWLLVGFLAVFSGLSIYDYYKIRTGKSSEIILQLPKGMKKRIHKSVRTYSRSTALVGSSIVMGFLISLFELGCTGQIYFPTITYMIRTEGSISGYLMLAVYNLAFIVPLVLIFVITYRGVSSEKVTSVFRKNLGIVKLGTACLFIVLAVITILN